MGVKEAKKAAEIASGPYIPGMTGAVKPEEQIVAAGNINDLREEEKIREQQEAILRQREQMDALVKLQEDQKARLEREELIRLQQEKLAKLAPWAKKETSPVKEAGQGMTLQEIQRMEAERDRKERQQRDMQEARRREEQRKMEEEERAMRALANQLQNKKNNNKNKKKKAEEEQKVKQIFNEKKPKNDFEDWCSKALQGLQAQVDIPTFLGFLMDIESPYEVHDYVKSYVGEGKAQKKFAVDYLERRSRWKNSLKSGAKYEDDLTTPANALTPGDGEFQFQEAGKKGKKTKPPKTSKSKQNISHLLGFSVTGQGVNRGELDMPQ